MSEQAGSTSNGSKMVGPREVVVHGNSRGRMDLGGRTAGLLGYEQGRSARTRALRDAGLVQRTGAMRNPCYFGASPFVAHLVSLGPGRMLLKVLPEVLLRCLTGQVHRQRCGHPVVADEVPALYVLGWHRIRVLFAPGRPHRGRNLWVSCGRGALLACGES
jgi:hypothetical protein